MFGKVDIIIIMMLVTELVGVFNKAETKRPRNKVCAFDLIWRTWTVFYWTVFIFILYVDIVYDGTLPGYMKAS